MATGDYTEYVSAPRNGSHLVSAPFLFLELCQSNPSITGTLPLSISL